jgi:hypothetical protein
VKKPGVCLAALSMVLVFAAGAAAVTVNGTIDSSDPTMTASPLFRNGVVGTCAAPKTNVAIISSGTRHYDSYTHTNSTGSTQCVTVSLTQTSGTGLLFTAAYLGSFNPANATTNYLADPGISGLLNETKTYSFLLPAGQTAVIVVHEYEPSGCLGCNYTLTYDAVTAAMFASARVTSTKQGELLRWRTASETDLLYFQVYRSRGHSWQRISRSPIAANGSVAGASYRFLDRTAKSPRGFRYRIKAFNRDGTASWFGPILTS